MSTTKQRPLQLVKTDPPPGGAAPPGGSDETLFQTVTRLAAGWLTHNDKKPYRRGGKSRTGKNGSKPDLAALMDYWEAKEQAEWLEHDGIGIVLGEHLMVLDFDKMRDASTGEITCEQSKRLIEAQGCGAMISPSGTGVHLFVDVSGSPELQGFKSGCKLQGLGNGSEAFRGPAGNYIRYSGTNLPGSLAVVRGPCPELLAYLRKTIKQQRAEQPPAPAPATGGSTPPGALPAAPRYNAEAGELGTPQGLAELADAVHALENVQEGGRNNELNAKAYRVYRAVGGGELDENHAQEALWNAAQAAQLDDFEIRKTLQSARGRAIQNPKTFITVGEAFGDGSNDVIQDQILRQAAERPTHDRMAMVAAVKLRDRFRYLHRSGWHEWDGTRWRVDETERVFQAVREVIWETNRYGKTAPQSANFMNGTLGILQKTPTLSVHPDDFDADNYLLNTPGGVIDLRNGNLRPHDPADKITLCTAVAPDATGGERFRQFMREITNDDQALITFLQVALGACLSGAREQHWLLFLYGSGRNGKSVLTELIDYVMGDYAGVAPASVFMASAQGDGYHLVKLRGKRVILAPEVEQNTYLKESLIKSLTGDEKVTARDIYAKPIAFIRMFKLWISGNHRPRLRSVGPAIRDRIKMVPFNVSFSGREDPELPAKLRAEAGYVLHWLMEGHTRWLELGRKLPPCEAVTGAGEEYFSAQPTAEQWITETLNVVPIDDRPGNQWPASNYLYQLYTQWVTQKGERHPASQVSWSDTMAQHFKRIRPKGTHWAGAELKDGEGDTPAGLFD